MNKGLGCSTCHGRVDQMPMMYEQNTLQMEWCLNCHRNAPKNLRPVSEIYNMAWQSPASDKPVWCGTSGLKAGVPTAQTVNCVTVDPAQSGAQVASLQLPATTDKAASSSDASTLPASLTYTKFTSQEALGMFLVKQYNIRSAHELSSCEVCHR